MITCEKSDHKYMASLRIPFQKHNQRRQLLDRDKYGVKTKKKNDSSFFMYRNQPSKFNENEEDDVEGKDFDAEILVCDDTKYAKDVHVMLVEMSSNLNRKTIHKKGTKLDMALKVVFYEAYCGGCISHMLKENSRIERVKVDVLGLHIKVMKQISKISPS